jgi:hypothetical protein
MLRAPITVSETIPIKFALRGSPFGSPRANLAGDSERKHPLTRNLVRPSGFEPETCGVSGVTFRRFHSVRGHLL